MSTPEFQPSAVDAAEFINSVAGTPEHELAEGMRSELRHQILDEIFTRMEEHFDPSKSAEVDAIIVFEITGQAEDDTSDKFQVIIKNDTCSTSRELTETQTMYLVLEAADFLRLIAGQTTGMDLYIGGKLKVDGNLLLATRLSGLFLIPEADESAATGPQETKE